ncbi:hypothetical protein D3C76_1458600 [compost metagenome]
MEAIFLLMLGALNAGFQQANRGIDRVRLHREGIFDFAPDHQLDQFIHVGVGRGQRLHIGAVAQDGDLVADSEDFIQVV